MQFRLQLVSCVAIGISAFALSATAKQIQSENSAFSAAGASGCIAANGTADGSPLIIHNCDVGPFENQDWLVTFPTGSNVGPLQIILTGAEETKCIDVTNGVNADGTKLQVWTCTEGNTNQLWTALTDGSFQWSGTDKCIDLTNGVTTDGNFLQIWTCGGGTNSNQGWDLGPRELVNFQSAPQLHTLCVAAASNTDGAEVAVVDCGSTASTFPEGSIVWTIDTTAVGNLVIFDDKCLDVTDGVDADGTRLQIWTCAAENTNQLFTKTNDQLAWSIGNNKCVDLTNGDFVSGTPLQIWDCAAKDTNPNQEWAFVSLEFTD